MAEWEVVLEFHCLSCNAPPGKRCVYRIGAPARLGQPKPNPCLRRVESAREFRALLRRWSRAARQAQAAEDEFDRRERDALRAWLREFADILTCADDSS